MNLSKFFKITNVALLLFAAELVINRIHELIQIGVVNPTIEVWNIKHILPKKYPDGNPATVEWFEILGSLLKVLFGYNANPLLLEVIVYPLLLNENDKKNKTPLATRIIVPRDSVPNPIVKSNGRILIT